MAQALSWSIEEVIKHRSPNGAFRRSDFSGSKVLFVYAVVVGVFLKKNLGFAEDCSDRCG